MPPPHALFVAGLTGLLVTVAPSLPAAGGEAGRCSMAIGLGPGTTEQTYVLVEPVGDSVQARLHHFDWYDLAGEWSHSPAPADTTWGAVFRVLNVDLGGENAPRVSAGDEIVVVPWEYDAGCDYQLWTEGLDWARPGPQIFQFTRSRRLRVEGRATFDVLGWHTPYPAGAFIDGRTRPAAPRDTWLPAEAYFDLLSHLPRSASPSSGERGEGSDADSVLDALADWSEDNPEYADAFPVPQLRDSYERRLR